MVTAAGDLVNEGKPLKIANVSMSCTSFASQDELYAEVDREDDSARRPPRLRMHEREMSQLSKANLTA